MPLRKPPKNATKKQRRRVASANIAKEMRAGKPRAQAIAIGLSSAGISRKKNKKGMKNRK